ncbi:peptide-methionine (R)-S-oxide reductase MsrB [Aurantibacter crassamenti]|uniref:peptide-methionine (R)-S-oxide reductase MsrB n=1 Tax=Aurantibacter crassamenti TaxID=1837375 RepID=UPI00193A0701|nr:peptide-methionine (R)-S-oxide reductase MsrB [Aurantibacter crassamenti]MBM1107875.1 peptide-methionine (R)-S-oxide reductase MsrB [Aurantibacter crassamenti]
MIINKLTLIIALAFIGCNGVSQEKKDSNKVDEKKETFAVTKTDAEWRSSLDDMQYYVLRQAGTENAFTSELLENKEKGVYVCAGCGTELFKSKHKFISGTGWPSFDREIKGNVSYDVDYKIGYKRTEEHCATCGGHLGHVFDDGPKKTTGKRHCINGAALKFVPTTK